MVRLSWSTLAVAALAAATLLLESTLTRLLAVTQFYHFAFLVVSLALLGFGASGTALSVLPGWRNVPSDRLLAYAGAGMAASTAVAYGVINGLPFDSYSIAWDRRQVLYFILYYLALAAPFFCGGLGIGAALAASSGHSHRLYAANLFGSALGALLAPAALALTGVPGAVLLAALIALLPVAGHRPWRALALAWLPGVLLLAWLGVLNQQGRAVLGLTLSPYKGLPQALRYPGSSRIFAGWNALSRVDVLAGAGTRQLPGLSYTYTGAPPPQLALTVDGDAPQAISQVAPADFAAHAYLPESVAFDLRPGAPVLVLEPGAGLGVLQALAAFAREGSCAPTSRAGGCRVTAVLGNSLVRRAVAASSGSRAGSDVYAMPGVRTILEPGRAYLGRDRDAYGIVYMPLTESFHPVTSGAYSLGETYGLTVEAFEAALRRLRGDGLLVVTRWLQVPPSESLRLVATLFEALRRTGVRAPGEAVVAYRGIQTITVLVQPGGWQAGELARVRAFAEQRRYDLVWAPDIVAAETNRFNQLAEPQDYLAIRDLLAASDPATFYAGYPFAVAPPTDDHPFFFHFFRWQQTPEVLATLGRTWQPFGGSGYFVLIAMLALALFLSALLILAPLAFTARRPARRADGLISTPVRPGGNSLPRSGIVHGSTASARGAWLRLRVFAYFGLIGLAFLFVEVPLIQRAILWAGSPTLAFTVVIVTLLAASGLGSLLAGSAWLPRQAAVAVVAILALVLPALLLRLSGAALGWSGPARLALLVALLAPLGVAMGLPFPLGLAWLEGRAPELVPWAWAVNGAASVIASVLAALLALGSGYPAVLMLGAACYAAAWLVLAGATPRTRPLP